MLTSSRSHSCGPLLLSRKIISKKFFVNVMGRLTVISPRYHCSNSENNIGLSSPFNGFILTSIASSTSITSVARRFSTLWAFRLLGEGIVYGLHSRCDFFNWRPNKLTFGGFVIIQILSSWKSFSQPYVGVFPLSLALYSNGLLLYLSDCPKLGGTCQIRGLNI